MKIEIGAGLTIITAVLVWAKVVGYISWSWWLVLLPTLLPLAIGVGILLVVAIIVIAGLLFTIIKK